MPWATLSATARGIRPAPSVEITVILSTALSGSDALATTTCGRTSTSVRRAFDERLEHGRVAVLGERVGLLAHALGLGRAQGAGHRRLGLALQPYRLRDRRTPGPLGLTLLESLDGVGLGRRAAALLLALTREPGTLGLRPGRGDAGRPLGLGLLDPGDRLGLGDGEVGVAVAESGGLGAEQLGAEGDRGVEIRDSEGELHARQGEPPW